jgi:Secretion system C-terminal sorting domain/PKD domain/Right handed beta helix region/Bacterial Ig domain/Bacterial Ig-like domain
MKNFFKNRPVSAFVFSEKLSVLFFLFTATIFAVSCQKDITEKINTPITADSETASQVAAAVAAANNTYYLSPSGNDNNAGTISSPFFSLNKVWAVIVPGDLVYLRGGTYAFKTQQYLTGKSGTAGNMITVQAYPNELPVLTKGAGYIYPKDERGGCYFSGNYVYFKGIRITGFTQENTFIWNGLLVENSNNCIFERLEVDNSGGGLNIRLNSSNNLVKNSDFHDNIDPVSGNNPGGNADGLDIAAGNGTNNVVTGCRAWNNSDDGFDCWEMKGQINFDSCWSWHNGYIPGTNTVIGNGVGFKLGGATGVTGLARKVTRCIAFNNYESGFHQNEADCRMELYNNTSYNNGVWGYLFDYQNKAHIFKNNIAFNNIGANVRTSASTALANNSFGGVGFAEAGWTNNVTAADFLSLDDKQVLNARQADGSLPVITFLNLAATSDLINTGIDVAGVSFTGTAPDRGAFETGGAAPPPPANQAPVANAGVDKNITLPTNSVSITGTATDPDGSIQSYSWTKQSGGAATLAGATTATLNLSALVAGSYVFRLTVTDNGGLTAFDEVTVTVNPLVTNTPPTANAGADQLIILPVNSLSLSGSGTDPDGSIQSYSWTKQSGGAATLSGATAATLNLSGLVAGTFIFRLTVTDDKGATGFDDVTVVVNPVANILPVANAGTNKIITLPISSVTLTGSGTDADGFIVSYNWVKISGPAQFSIASPAGLQTAVTNLVQGVYQFEFQVTDNAGGVGKSSVTVTVNAAPVNQPPVANAGNNIIITLPTNSVSLAGSGTDADGTIVGYNWTKISGPAQFTILSPSNALTPVNNLVAGIYQFQLQVTDNGGATGTSVITVTVNAAVPPPNQPPVANAGANITITLPTNSVSLTGSGTDADGIITGYNWAKISGPTQFNILTPNTAQTTITNLVQGTYQIQLTVTDNAGATGTATVTVTVNAAPPPPNQSPTASAGTDVTIILPTNSVTLLGSGTDPDGTIVGYSWTKTSGPTQLTILTPNSPQTIVNNLVQGTYQFQIQVTDNAGATGTATVKVIVNAAAVVARNQRPKANAGGPRKFKLPVARITLAGSGTDPDGIITGYQWNFINGPSQVQLSDPLSATTDVTNIAEGTYQFALTVTDNNGASAADTIEVKASNILATGVSIFPNPVQDIVNLKIEATTLSHPTSIVIYDMNGKQVYRESITRGQSTLLKKINVARFSKGTYIIEVSADPDSRIPIKMLKQ